MYFEWKTLELIQQFRVKIKMKDPKYVTNHLPPTPFQSTANHPLAGLCPNLRERMHSSHNTPGKYRTVPEGAHPPPKKGKK